MTVSKNEKSDLNSIIQFVIGSFIAIVFLSSSYGEFSSQKQYIKSLKNDAWQKWDIMITPEIEFNFIKYRTGEMKMQIKKDQQTFYENSCSDGLKNICAYINNKEINVISLNFYSNSENTNPNNHILFLNTLTFIDKNGKQQIFPKMPYPPNSAHFIAEEIKAFRSILLIAFIKHLFFALFFVAHISTIYTFKASTEKWIRYFILTAFSVSFLSFVIRYFLI